MIRIANKLEVKRGNVIQVPGCEPLSAVTSFTLLANNPCANTQVALADALDAIPGSSVQILLNPRTLVFVLPDGPPSQYGCATETCNDWYAILRELGEPVPEEEDQLCEPGKASDSFEYFNGYLA